MPSTLNVSGTLYGMSVPLPRYVDARAFAAATAESWTVPTNINVVILSGTVPFYIRIGGTAAVPGDTSDGTGSFYIPSSAQFKVEEGVAISIIPTAAGVVTIAGYSR